MADDREIVRVVVEVEVNRRKLKPCSSAEWLDGTREPDVHAMITHKIVGAFSYADGFVGAKVVAIGHGDVGAGGMGAAVTGSETEKLAAAINKLALDMQRAKQLVTEDALVILLSSHSRVGMKSIRDVIRAIERLPEKVLTAQGRAIRIRED